ncbi:MAG: hypothetical protein RTV72_08905 [Candidatus Thorarchaeota archaeon]
MNGEPLVPGGRVEGHVLVSCDDDFQCERLLVSLNGEEVARVVIHAGKVTIVHEEKREHISEINDLAECLIVPMGESRYEFSFSLPSDIPGSYKGSHAWIKYILEAKAEISWARDLKSKMELDLGFNSEVNPDLTPSSKSESVESDGITLLKAETDRDRFPLADKLDFRFFVDRDASMRGVRAELVRLEHVEPKGHKMDSKKTLAEIYFKEDEIRRDTWIESSFPIDANWTESFKTELIEYSYILKLTLDVARRKDKIIEIPIVLNGRRDRDQLGFDF